MGVDRKFSQEKRRDIVKVTDVSEESQSYKEESFGHNLTQDCVVRPLFSAFLGTHAIVQEDRSRMGISKMPQRTSKTCYHTSYEDFIVE